MEKEVSKMITETQAVGIKDTYIKFKELNKNLLKTKCKQESRQRKKRGKKYG